MSVLPLTGSTATARAPKRRRIIRAAEIAQRLGVATPDDDGVVTVRRRMDKGLLPFFFDAGERVMFEDELDAYLERCRAQGGVTVDEAVENSRLAARGAIARGRHVGTSRTRAQRTSRQATPPPGPADNEGGSPHDAHTA